MTNKNIERAILAGGCFWGMQDILRSIPGVIKSQVGYTGGHTTHPKYENVCTGQTGHAEAIEIYFDKNILSYKALLSYFFRMHNPTTPNQQMNDKGSQYRSAIFYISDEQKAIAAEMIRSEQIQKLWKEPIVTELSPAQTFYSAEAEHQDYLQKNPDGYSCHYLRPE